MIFSRSAAAPLAAAFAAALSLSACGAVLHQNEGDVLFRLGSTLEPPRRAADYAGYFAPYALLAAKAYDDLDPAAPGKQPGSKLDFGDAAGPALKWLEEWRYAGGEVGPLPCRGGGKECGALEGLQYMIWTHGKGVCDEIVIAFRGTDFKSEDDWKSNLRWLRRGLGEYDQYEQVQEHIKRIVTTRMMAQACYRRGQTKLTAVGHSLGGGLAQNAAYVDARIQRVYAFDPSFVTGYYDVHTQAQSAVLKKLEIDRVYEHGEILAYGRYVLRRLYPPSPCNPQVRNVRFNRASGNLVDQHNMAQLAAELTRLAGPPAAARAKMRNVAPLPVAPPEARQAAGCDAAMVAWIRE